MTFFPNRVRNSRIAFLAGLGLLVLSLGQSGMECPFFMPTPPDTQPTTGNSGLTGPFVGSTRCMQCHSSIHADWSQTLHAKAFETLEAIGQDDNPVCVRCHVVGLNSVGGFSSRALTNDLAGVGCEACHGPGRAHVENVQDASLRPPKNISSAVCGACHTGSHHPNYDEWLTSGHAMVTEGPSNSFAGGTNLNNCGKCHSGDFFYQAIISGETVLDNALENVKRSNQNGVTCAVCHNPHTRTGNAAGEIEDGRDYQLRYPEVAFPTPTNTIDATTNSARFNICGQCHHGRGRTWRDNARGPHHSVQANVYTGEMAMPDDDGPVVPLAPSRLAKHYEAEQQCATCHMYRKDFDSDQAPAIAGHSFQVSFEGCVASGCHTSGESIQNRAGTYKAEIQARLDAIVARLEALHPNNGWNYTSEGGPGGGGQAALSENVRKVRFLHAYILADGSYGIHNPPYVEGMLDAAEALLDAEENP